MSIRLPPIHKTSAKTTVSISRATTGSLLHGFLPSLYNSSDHYLNTSGSLSRNTTFSLSSLSEPVRITKRRRRPTGLGSIKLRLHLRTLGQVIVWCQRKINTSEIAIVYESIQPYLDQFTNSEDDRNGFNKNRFKFHRDFAVLNKRAADVLKRAPKLRSESDIDFVCIQLRQLRSFAKYPILVQSKLAKNAVYQKYSARRVILRQGHRPTGFYIILRGTVLAFHFNFETGQALPMMIISEGNQFGDSDMIESQQRKVNWISMTEMEVLWITAEDYAEIFHIHGIYAEQRSCDDKTAGAAIHRFIRTLPCFKNWPFAFLSLNSALFSYKFFNPKEVIDVSTTSSTSIYVVVMGRVNVVKRLPLPKPTNSKGKDLFLGTRMRGLLKPKFAKQLGVYDPSQETVYGRMSLVYGLHETLMRRNKIKKEQQSQPTHLPSLPIIPESPPQAEEELVSLVDVDIVDLVDALESSSEESSSEASSVVSSLPDVSQLTQQLKNRRNAMTRRDAIYYGYLVTHLEEKLKDSAYSLLHKPAQKVEEEEYEYDDEGEGEGKEEINPILASLKLQLHRNPMNLMGKQLPSAPMPWLSKNGLQIVNNRLRLERQLEKVHTTLTALGDIFEFDNDKVTILIETLTPGKLFGLGQVFFEKQPDCMLIAESVAEVFVIDRNFYLQNAPEELRIALETKFINSYPTDRTLITSLQYFVDWNCFKDDFVKQQYALQEKLRDVKRTFHLYNVDNFGSSSIAQHDR